MRSLKAWAWSLLVAALVAFTLGIVLARIYLCGQPGPWAFLVSVGLGSGAAFLFLAAAMRGRSWRLALGAVGAACLTGLLLFFSMAFTLPGCSGV